MKKILLVEDDPNLGLLLQDYLQLKGKFDVVLCVDGDEGLRAFTKQEYDLCILDVMMPKMNGFDVCKTVKKDWGLDDVFIIMLTAKGQEYDKEKGQEVGANLYITKPFNPDEIMAHALKVFDIELD